MIQQKDFKPLSSAPETLVAEGLRKSCGSRCALQGLSFSLKAKHILPNGAGKTTSIRILTTMDYIEGDQTFLSKALKTDAPL